MAAFAVEISRLQLWQVLTGLICNRSPAYCVGTNFVVHIFVDKIFGGIGSEVVDVVSGIGVVVEGFSVEVNADSVVVSIGFLLDSFVGEQTTTGLNLLNR